MSCIDNLVEHNEMHQQFDDGGWGVAEPPDWISELADELEQRRIGGWTSQYHIDNTLAFLGMLEIEQITAPQVWSKLGPICVLWTKGSRERLEVTIEAPALGYVVRSVGQVVQEELECTPVGLRNVLLNFYPFVKNSFNRKFRV